ncbi:hypothetical protein Bca4012_031881 [Brassica carinata]
MYDSLPGLSTANIDSHLGENKMMHIKAISISCDSLRREAASKEVEDNVTSSYQGTGAEHERSTVATSPREMRPQTLIARCLQLPNNPPNKANPENHERSQATTTSSEQKYMHKAIWRIDRGVERHTVGAQNSEVENRSKPQCTAIGATVRRALNPSY